MINVGSKSVLDANIEHMNLTCSSNVGSFCDCLLSERSWTRWFKHTHRRSSMASFLCLMVEGICTAVNLCQLAGRRSRFRFSCTVNVYAWVCVMLCGTWYTSSSANCCSVKHLHFMRYARNYL